MQCQSRQRREKKKDRKREAEGDNGGERGGVLIEQLSVWQRGMSTVLYGYPA